MKVDRLEQLLLLDVVARMTICTVESLPASETLNGRRNFTNRFIAIDDAPILVDGVFVVQSRSGQKWLRIRDVA